MDPKLAKSKAYHLLSENTDLLKHVIDELKKEVIEPKIEASSEFELAKKYYINEGIREGLRRIMQRLNEIASKDI